MRKLVIIIGCLTFIFNVSAQKRWNLRECINYAIEHNIDIERQLIQVKSAEIDLSTSKNSRLPKLDASADMNYNAGKVASEKTNLYESINATSSNLSVSSALPIFTGFRIPNEIKMNKYNLMSATEGLKKAKENIELQITSYYLDVLFKKEILKVHEEQASLSQKQKEKTEILVETGKVAKSQLYDILSQLAKDQSEVTTAKNDLNYSLLILTQALNLLSVDNFDIEEPNISDSEMTDKLFSSLAIPDQVYKRALEIKPQIKEATYQIESSKKSLKVARAGFFPQIDFNLGYSTSLQRVYNIENKSFRDQFKDNANKGIGFTLRIPIFNRLATRNKVRQARLDIQDKEYNFELVKQSLYKEIQQAYQNATAASAKFKSTKEAYDAAYESFKYAEERYQIGKISVFEYSEAQTKLVNSQSEKIQSKYDFIFRSKILDFYQGKEIDNL